MSDAKSLGIKFIEKARKTAEMLKEVQQVSKKLKLLGSFSALYWSVWAATIGVLFGGLVAPFVAIAMALSGIGGVVHAGASFTDMFIEKFNLVVLQDDWEKFVTVLFDECKDLKGQSKKLLKRISRHTAMVANGISIIKNLKSGAKIARNVMVLNAIVIPFNLIDFVRSVEDLKENGMSEVCKLILEYADIAEELIEKIETISLQSDEKENGSENKSGNGSGNKNGNGSENQNEKGNCDDKKNSKSLESITLALPSKHNCGTFPLGNGGYFYRK